MKIFRIFHLKTFIFLVVKFSVYLNRLVLVMTRAHHMYDVLLTITTKAVSRGAANDHQQHIFAWRNKKKCHYFWVETNALSGAMLLVYTAFDC